MMKPAVLALSLFALPVCLLMVIVCGGGGRDKATTTLNPVVPATGLYGPGIQADSLANTQLGGTYNTQTSYRFLCDHDGMLQGIRFYLVGHQVGEPDYRPGYSAGTGGTVQVELCPDDASTLHAPVTSQVLARLTLSNPLSARYFPTCTFDSSAALEKGKLYHLVFRNTDADPSNNYISVNSLFVEVATTPLQSLHSDQGWGQLLGYTVNGVFRWEPRDNMGVGHGYTPILQLNYQDGYRAGIGYSEVWINPRTGTSKGGPKSISGNAGVGLTFTVSGSHQRVTGVHLRVARILGSSPLTIKLESSSGELLAKGQIQAQQVSSSYAFASCLFSAECHLRIGNTYRLRLSAPTGTEYRTFPIAKASDTQVAFAPETYWRDGYAEWSSDGSTWQKWDQWWDGPVFDPSNMGMLQFWFDADEE